ncbi:butyrate kinase [Desulfocurvus sp.]|jgi:butyrate kinase|uniref:butyrate kinase n=1 Tax=Desulfocurvus sp. TaxID=2871698 RepID=UPI0025BA61DD|nr:butyrate kinase [Desulfocurvus sp.]MCK9239304.1 butyrate kinase [Desulfocurvus sp.]
MRVLAINPGGTSTKIAAFEGSEELFSRNVQHPQELVNGFPSVVAQGPFRREAILDALREAGLALDGFACVVGRGGLLKRLPGGTYRVSPPMLEDLRAARFGEHPSNLGPILARELADEACAPAYTVDPVSVDEFWDVARISGISELERPSWMHALNQKAVCREIAAQLGGTYADYNFIVAHLGSGVSVAAHTGGRMVDGSGGRSNGPFSPERSGGLPAYPLVNLCYSGKYTHKEMVDLLSVRGGMYDYLGTKDMLEIEARCEAGDERATLVLDAFIYQVACEIARYGAALRGRVDRIIITGGIARSRRVVDGVAGRVGFLAPIAVLPGEKEMESLALGALRVLRGEETAREY